MGRLIKAQCNVLIQQKGAVFCFLLLLVAVGGNFIYNVIQCWGIEQAVMYSFLEISVLSQENKVGWYVVMFFSFLLVLPGGMSLAVDKKTKTDILWVGRCGKKNYLISKMIAVFLVTFLCFFIPFIIELGLNLLAFPATAHGNLGGWELYRESYENVRQYFLFTLYYAHPALYAVIMSVIISTAAALLSMVPLACSCFFYKYYAYLLVPVYFLLSLFQKTKFSFGKVNFSHNYYYYFQWCHGNIHREDLFVFGCLIMAISLLSCVVVLYSVRKDTI